MKSWFSSLKFGELVGAMTPKDNSGVAVTLKIPQLPNGLWELIFLRIQNIRDVIRLRKTCKRLYTISKSNNLWKKYYTNYFKKGIELTFTSLTTPVVESDSPESLFKKEFVKYIWSSSRISTAQEDENMNYRHLNYMGDTMILTGSVVAHYEKTKRVWEHVQSITNDFGEKGFVLDPEYSFDSILIITEIN